MKRLVFCFDGTTNKLAAVCPTNVVLMAESVVPTAKDGTAQPIHYDEGVGTGKWARLTGMLFGVGLVTNLREAYRFLIFNHEPGDEIFIFGFSRGAFTARSFAGLVRHVGVLDVNSAAQIDRAFKMYEAAMDKAGDDHPDALAFRAQHSSRICVSEYDRDWRCQHFEGFDPAANAMLAIRYVGVWDTVGALGFPNVLPFAQWLNRRKGFHDVRLTSKVQAARHALAIDERRKLFRPTLWGNVNELNSEGDHDPWDYDAPYQQRWFPGVHGAVGGGGPERGLSDSAFSWILSGARREGLNVSVQKTSRIYEVSPDPYSPLQNEPRRPWYDRGLVGKINHLLLHTDREGPSDLKDVSAFARQRWLADPALFPERMPYRPKTLMPLAAEIERHAPAAPPAVGDLETKAMTVHEVQSGEDLPELARHYLGDSKRWLEIYELNRDWIDDPAEIHPGWPLRLPCEGAPGDQTE